MSIRINPENPIRKGEGYHTQKPEMHGRPQSDNSLTETDIFTKEIFIKEEHDCKKICTLPTSNDIDIETTSPKYKVEDNQFTSNSEYQSIFINEYYTHYVHQDELPPIEGYNPIEINLLKENRLENENLSVRDRADKKPKVLLKYFPSDINLIFNKNITSYEESEISNVSIFTNKDRYILSPQLEYIQHTTVRETTSYYDGLESSSFTHLTEVPSNFATGNANTPLDKALNSQNISQFHLPSEPLIQKISEIIIRSIPTSNEIELTLSPDELGKLKFTFSHSGNETSINITASHPETLSLLRRNITTLSAELMQLGMNNATFSFNEEHKKQNEERHRHKADNHPDFSATPSPDRGQQDSRSIRLVPIRSLDMRL